jgi:HD-GYP domain-containing protein (c-di-GMP phosphodiesterase class II)
MKPVGFAGVGGERLRRRIVAMDFDSYESPDAETLLKSARDRFVGRKHADRLLATEAAGAAVFLVAAFAFSLLVTPARHLSASTLAITVAAYLIAARVQFPVGSAWTRPTQVVFVPMLFLLPIGIVPLVVAGSLVLDLWPELPKHRVSLMRVLARLGDSLYTLGPAIVLVLAHQQRFSWGDWPVLVVAFLAQIVLDSGSGFARTWFAEGVRPSKQPQMLWLYLTDGCLSCAGLLVAASAVTRPVLVLLALPMIALLGLFARERQHRVDSTLELSSAYRGTALLLGDVLEADDEYTGIHSRQVVELSLAVADALRLDATARRNTEFGALLHDVGKIRVPSSIIKKPDRLNAAEWEIMRRHTIAGEDMLKQVGGTLTRVGSIVRSSHERYDGEGYPDGLAGEAIPIEARIISACDAYNAMTTDRPYRAALGAAVALEELRRCAGSQFDPVVVAALEGELTAQADLVSATLRELGVAQ